MFRAIKPNKYKFSDIQITESVISFTERNLQSTANFTQNTRNLQSTANFTQNIRNLQYTANFPKKFRIFAAHFIFSNQDRMQNE